MDFDDLVPLPPVSCTNTVNPRPEKQQETIRDDLRLLGVNVDVDARRRQTTTHLKHELLYRYPEHHNDSPNHTHQIMRDDFNLKHAPIIRQQINYDNSSGDNAQEGNLLGITMATEPQPQSTFVEINICRNKY